MKIAITADIHLRQDKKERLQNFEQILNLLQEKKINIIIIAGDLFDKGYNSYKEFDAIAKKYTDISFFIIPGNHDENIKQKMFGEKNIRIISDPDVCILGDKQFLFLPYKNSTTMNRVIEESGKYDELKKNNWYLISHGDFGRTSKKITGNELGYFPLTRRDINTYSPAKVILGHIHMPSSIDYDVIYPGSPYPLDINEQTQRRIIILDTKNDQVKSEYLDNPPINIIAELFVIPNKEEKNQIKDQIEEILINQKKNYIGNNFNKKANIRIIIEGYTSSIEGIAEYVKELLKKKEISIDEVNTDFLEHTEDENLSIIALMVKKKVEDLDIDYENKQILRHQILQKTMQMIYKR
ncbi:MAG: metallophosphoesterase [Spirochaetes bacterium]|nr:metallophosphoesterase [Spirochaetota bacterium]